MNKRIITVIMLLVSVVVFAGCDKSEPIEHNAKDRFIYFTDISGENPITIDMEKGSRNLMVTMDDGELWISLVGENGESVLNTDATFSDDYTVDIPVSGKYTLTLNGKNASGSVNY